MPEDKELEQCAGEEEALGAAVACPCYGKEGGSVPLEQAEDRVSPYSKN